MKSLRLTAPGEFLWSETQEPQLVDKGVLVRPIAASTCDFDHLLTSARMVLPLPISIGHEFVGEVILVGKSVRLFKEGDRVIVPLQINCGECARCKSGHTASCEAVPWLSVYGLGNAAGELGGAMSDCVAVPYADAMLIALPDDLPAEQAPCLSCNMPDALRCVGPQLASNPGAPVFIAGGAFDNIALYALAIAKSLGSPQVDLLGLHPSMREKAEALGGRILTSKKDVNHNYYPITVDASQNTELLGLAIHATAPAGELTVSTMYTAPNIVLPLLKMFEKCVTFKTGQPNVRDTMELALDIVRKNKELFAAVIDEVLPWDDAAYAFSKGVGKTVLVRA